MISAETIRRIWGDEWRFRLFMSHKAEIKSDAATLSDRLRQFGVSAFVAHAHIRPMQEWQDEIERALASMEGFVALLTEKFHDSNWTDQEVGFTVARDVPILAVRLGKDPYGFIGKFQGLSANFPKCDLDIVKILIKHPRMFEAYVQALRAIPTWDTGNLLADVPPSIEQLSANQIDQLVAAYNETDELRGCFAFNGKNSRYGSGVLPHLHGLTKTFVSPRAK